MGSAKGFACCADKIALQRFSRCEGNRVEHHIDAICLAARVFKKSPNLIVAGDIARKQRSFFSKLADQLLDVFLYPLALIIKNQTCAGRGPGLRDCPGDATLVRHAEPPPAGPPVRRASPPPSPAFTTPPLSASLTPTPSPGAPQLTDVLFKNLKARSIGPAVMGGRVSDIAIDPHNPFVFYVGLGHGGVFKTTDNGVTFDPIFDNQPALSIGAVDVTASDSVVFWLRSCRSNHLHT